MFLKRPEVLFRHALEWRGLTCFHDGFRFGHCEVPDMLFTEEAREAEMFRSFNGIITDPVADEHDRIMSNVW